MSLKAPRGTVDTLPKDVKKWQYVETKIKSICDTFHFEEIRTPFLNIQNYSNEVLEIQRILCKKKCIHLKIVVVEA